VKTSAHHRQTGPHREIHPHQLNAAASRTNRKVVLEIVEDK